jgi:uncharacterized coiled-coil protein SlyX
MHVYMYACIHSFILTCWHVFIHSCMIVFMATKAELEAQLAEQKKQIDAANHQLTHFSTRTRANKKAIKDLAHEQGRGVQAVVTEALEEWIKKQKAVNRLFPLVRGHIVRG